MNTKLATLALATTASILFASAGYVSSDDTKPAAAKESKLQRLTAIYVKEAPKLDAEADWGSGGQVIVDTKYGKQGPVSVTMQARTDGEYIYMKASWYDASYSVAKKEWAYSKKDGWQQGKQDEDRFALAFNINVKTFAEKGCMSLCHKADEYMGTHVEGETADLWHWKAARGGRFGYADEQGFSFGEDGRGSDDGQSAYAANKGKGGPLRVWKTDADRQGAFNFETSVEMDSDYQAADGETAPGYYLRTADGSRADVQSDAVHKNGLWTVLLKRKLVTADEGDVKFEAGKTVLFAASVMDNSGVHANDDHTKSKAVELYIEPAK